MLRQAPVIVGPDDQHRTSRGLKYLVGGRESSREEEFDTRWRWSYSAAAIRNPRQYEPGSETVGQIHERRSAMRKFIIGSAAVAARLLLTVLAAGWLAPSSAALAQADVCQANPSPPDAADPEIIVDSPAAGNAVTSPITVTGQARTFESNVQVALFDSDGSEIASTFGTAQAPDVGIHGPFTIMIEFPATAPGDACLWVFEDSAKSGDSINVVQVALLLEQPALPSTGAAGPSDEALPLSLIIGTLLILGLGTIAVAGWLVRIRAV